MWTAVSELLGPAKNGSLITHIEVDNSDGSIARDSGWMQEGMSVQDNSFDLWGIIVSSNYLVGVTPMISTENT